MRVVKHIARIADRTAAQELQEIPKANMAAWGRVIGMYQSLHGLRGFWPMSSITETPTVIDLSGQGRALSRTNALFNASAAVAKLVPYASFNTDRYLSRADEAGFDIIGTEAYVTSAQRGLTVGAWVRPVTAGASDSGIISKYATSGDQRSYLLYRANTTDLFRFIVSTDGINTVGQSTTVTWTSGSWYFVVGRFVPSTTIDIFVNGVKSSNATGIPASIYASTANFEIGSYGGGASATTWEHQQTLCFLCAASLAEDAINALYHNSRVLFGV